MKKVVILPFAELDIKDSIDHYRCQQTGLDTLFIKKINTSFKEISTRPLSFPIIKYNIRKAVVRTFPYSIYFIDAETAIYILAVFHNKRNPKAWKRRKPVEK